MIVYGINWKLKFIYIGIKLLFGHAGTLCSWTLLYLLRLWNQCTIIVNEGDKNGQQQIFYNCYHFRGRGNTKNLSFPPIANYFDLRKKRGIGETRTVKLQKESYEGLGISITVRNLYFNSVLFLHLCYFIYLFFSDDLLHHSCIHLQKINRISYETNISAFGFELANKKLKEFFYLKL